MYSCECMNVHTVENIVNENIYYCILHSAVLGLHRCRSEKEIPIESASVREDRVRGRQRFPLILASHPRGVGYCPRDTALVAPSLNARCKTADRTATRSSRCARRRGTPSTKSRRPGGETSAKEATRISGYTGIVETPLNDTSNRVFHPQRQSIVPLQ